MRLLSRTNLPLTQKMMEYCDAAGESDRKQYCQCKYSRYRSVEVAFEEELRSAFDRTKLEGTRADEEHVAVGGKDLSGVNAEAYHPYDPTLPSGVNNVDIDMEMAKLAETQITYNYAVRFGQGVFKKLNAAIQGKSLQ